MPFVLGNSCGVGTPESELDVVGYDLPTGHEAGQSPAVTNASLSPEISRSIPNSDVILAYSTSEGTVHAYGMPTNNASCLP